MKNSKKHHYTLFYFRIFRHDSFKYLVSKESILGIVTSDIISLGKMLCTICIVFAMAALGLQIDFKKFLKSGFRVFGLAFVLGLVLIFGGYFLILAFKGILW